MKSWTDRYSQWERSIELKYGITAETTPQGGNDPLGLLVKAYRKDAPPSGLLDRESYRQEVKKARDWSTRRFLDDLKWWRSDFVMMFADDMPIDNPTPVPALEHLDVSKGNRCRSL